MAIPYPSLSHWSDVPELNKVVDDVKKKVQVMTK